MVLGLGAIMLGLLQEGCHLPGPKSGLLSTLGNELARREHALLTNRDFAREWVPGQENSRVRNLGKCFATKPVVSGFMVLGLVSRMSLANH